MYKLKRKEIEQVTPITFNADGSKLNFSRLDGKTEQNGTPTPENQVDIENIEGVNLFNINDTDNYEPTRINMTITDNKVNLKAISTTGAQFVRNYVKNVNPNKNYTISFKAKKIVKGTDGNPGIYMRLYGSNDDNTYTNLGTSGTERSASNIIQGQEYSFSRTTTGYKYYRLYFYNNSSTPVTIGEETEYWDIQFKEGSVALPYVPYNSIAVKVENANICRLETSGEKIVGGIPFTVEEGIIKINGTTSSTSNSYYFDNFRIKNSGTATFWIEVTGYTDKPNQNASIILQERTENSSWSTTREIVLTSTSQKQYQVTLDNSKYYRIRFYTLANIFTNAEIKIMLEYGTQKTTYVLHAEQASYFTFEAGQYLAEGGYLADDGIHNVYAQKSLNGTEDWKSADTAGQYYAYYLLISDIKSVGSIPSNNFWCDSIHFVSSSSYAEEGGGYLIQRNFVIFSSETSVNDFKTWLSNHNMILQYELADPQPIPYTPTQQAQWDTIKELIPYIGVNNIDVINRYNLSPKIYFNYHPELTDEIKTAVKKNPEKAYIEVLDDGTILNETNYLKEVNLNDERYLDKQGIFGTVIAKELTGKFINVDSLFNIENKEIKYYNGPVMSDNSVNYFDYGTYIVQKPENDNVKDNTSFTALDYMVKFNKKFEDRLDYDDPENPVTIGILLQDICNQCEVKLATKTFRNSDYILENNQFVGGETCREVLSAIAQIAFSWARINEDDELALDFNITDEIVEELDNDDYFSLEFNNKYGPINTIVLSNSQIEGENFTIHSDDFDPETDEEITLEIQDNPFAYTEQKRSELIQAGNAIFGFEYIPMKIKTAGKNYLNCLDKIKIKNMQDEYYETYIFNNKLDFKGITLDEKESPAMTDAQVKYQYTGEMFEAIKRTEISVDKNAQLIQSLVAVTDSLDKNINLLDADMQKKLEDLGIALTEYQATVSTQFTQTTQDFLFQFNQLIQNINTIESQNNEKFSNINKYIRFVDGNIVLGSSDNQLILEIRQDRISFQLNGQEVAYFSNNALEVEKITVNQSLRIGKFAFIPRENGSLSFGKVG